MFKSYQNDDSTSSKLDKTGIMGRPGTFVQFSPSHGKGGDVPGSPRKQYHAATQLQT